MIIRVMLAMTQSMGMMRMATRTVVAMMLVLIMAVTLPLMNRVAMGKLTIAPMTMMLI